MAYSGIEERLGRGETVLLDGGIGTELERRGAPMNSAAWCGAASLTHAGLLEDIHLDYIRAGADVITANTYASSRIMLEEAGLGDRFEESNGNAIAAARSAREKSGRDDIAIAGSLSHMVPMRGGSARSDPEKLPPRRKLQECYGELARFLAGEGCDLLILEMMYEPDRALLALEAAQEAGLPIWVGFSARRDDNGQIMSFLPDRDIPFADLVKLVRDYDVDAAGVMHTPANLIAEALDILTGHYDGRLTAYPDSGYFKMPRWQFEEIIPPETFRDFAREWSQAGVQIIGGCCGLSPDHIAALRPLRDGREG